MREVDRAFEVGCQHLLDGAPRLRFEQAEGADTGIVDQDIDLEVARCRRQRGDAGRSAEVATDGGRAVAERGAQWPQATVVAPGEQQHGTGSGQLAGEFLAETAAGAGEEDARMIQLHVASSTHGRARKTSP
jgi:hypothetical protein